MYNKICKSSDWSAPLVCLYSENWRENVDNNEVIILPISAINQERMKHENYKHSCPNILILAYNLSLYSVYL